MKTGKERMIDAFGAGSPDDIPSVLCYANLAMWRGPHFWDSFAEGKPWWIKNSWDIPKLLEVVETQQRKINMDWIWGAGLCPSREWRKNHMVVQTSRATYMRDITPGTQVTQYIIEEPPPEGTHSLYPNVDLSSIIKTIEDVEKYIFVRKAETIIEEGRTDWLESVIKKFGEHKFIVSSIGSPFSRACDFYGPMPSLKLFIKNPTLLKQLVEKMADQIIETIKAFAMMGSDGVWAWEWYTGEMISFERYNTIGKSAVERCIRAAQKLGLKYIYYPTGVGKNWQAGFESMIKMKPDGIHLEDSRKGFDTNISWQANVLKTLHLEDDVTIFGNVHPINLLQEGTSKELDREVMRQINIGRNDYAGRFIMDAGSPITPETTLDRVVEYMELTRKYGKKM
jgi:uroporphyrinogen-III decarboxylase